MMKLALTVFAVTASMLVPRFVYNLALGQGFDPPPWMVADAVDLCRWALPRFLVALPVGLIGYVAALIASDCLRAALRKG